ncbi:GNAT family N-acetyltransferase [Leptothrix ochracea]|uniref:GNAT family N-acetyltransferase n=1 Tax=Leptothrix ochracea TaxID=735331 RepID=UPI0034E2EDEC
MVASLAPSIQHDTQRQRFTAEVAGLTCIATYQRRGHHIVMDHTGVPAELQGQGLAALLVQAALDWARQEGLKVVPQCSYVAVYMRRHPATHDLLYRTTP